MKSNKQHLYRGVIYKYILCVWAFCSFCADSRGQSRTYEQEEIIKVAGITTENQVDELDPAGKQTTRTYFDGLNRPVQIIAVKASPQLKDIIQPLAYDNLGRQTKSYLPYVSSAADGLFRPGALAGEQATYYRNGAADKVQDDLAPFSEKLFESSPLQRLVKEGGVGAGYQPIAGGHFKSAVYRSNTATDSILLWTATGTTAPSYYGAGTLSVTEGTDEQNARTQAFTDQYGRLVLKRIFNGSEKLDTYYLYNLAGQVSYVVPPKAIAMIKAGGNYTLSQSGVNRLVFKYTYDEQGRLCEKTIPSSAVIYFIYDPLDRPVLVQDGNMRAKSKWTYIKYDGKGRAIIRGLYTNTTQTTRAAMQQYVSALDYSASWSEERSTNSSNGYYTNSVFPASTTEPLAYSYFDDYDVNNDGNDDYSYKSQGLNGETAASNKVRGLLTAARIRTVGAGLSNLWITSVYFYNNRGQAIQTLSNNHLNTALADTKTIVPDFLGKPFLQKVVKVSATSISIQTGYAYDSGGRLISIDQSYNGAAAIRIAGYTYNELGQLVKKGLHSLNNGQVLPADISLGASDALSSTEQRSVSASNSITLKAGFSAASGSRFSASISSNQYVQTLDYRYNIRGQLLSINNSTLTADDNKNNDSGDVFGLELAYDETVSGMGNTPYYSGQLSAVRWMSRNTDGTASSERSYKYSYDPAGRLTDALYQEKVNGLWNGSGTFDEKGIRYDAGGNIQALKRNTLTGGSIVEADNLQYTYDPADPSRLKAITDGSGAAYTGFGFKNLTGNTVSNYDYDENGNLKTDPYKGLGFAYNELNRAESITLTGAPGRYIKYTYDAGGQLLRKMQYNNNALQKTTDYSDGFVYENGALAYFGMPEGRVRNAGGTLTPEYMIADQQGNVRISFENNNGVAKLVQENSYYAFGLVMPGSGVATPANPNKNLYNGGSEWQNDYGDLPDLMQTFYRQYDAALGRWTGVDPKADSFQSLSVYNYAGNNPVMFNDPLGDAFATWSEVRQVIDFLASHGDNGGHASSLYDVSTFGSQDEAFTYAAAKITTGSGWKGTYFGSYERAATYYHGVSPGSQVNPNQQSFYVKTTSWYRDNNGKAAVYDGLSGEANLEVVTRDKPGPGFSFSEFQGAVKQWSPILSATRYTAIAGTYLMAAGVAGGEIGANFLVRSAARRAAFLEDIAPLKRLTQLRSIVGGRNAGLLRKLFGPNEKGAQAVLENIDNVEIPEGLSKETLQAYRELIDMVGDPRGTQALRAQILDKLLNRL